MVLDLGFTSESPVALWKHSDSQAPPQTKYIQVLGSGDPASVVFSQATQSILTGSQEWARLVHLMAKNHISKFESL